MSEESTIKESDLLRRLERWTEASKAPSRLELTDFLQDLSFNQLVDSLERLLGYVRNLKE